MGESQLTLLSEMLDLIERYAGTVSRADLENDRETWLKVRGALELAAQCAVDLALNMVSKHGAGVPGTYREAFTLLAGKGILDPDLARDLEGWAGLRNVLVHVYTTLDLDRIVAALSETEPLRRFHAVAAADLVRSAD